MGIGYVEVFQEEWKKEGFKHVGKKVMWIIYM